MENAGLSDFATLTGIFNVKTLLQPRASAEVQVFTHFAQLMIFLKRTASFFEVTSAFSISQTNSLTKMNKSCMHVFSLPPLWVPGFYDFPHFRPDCKRNTLLKQKKIAFREKGV